MWTLITTLIAMAAVMGAVGLLGLGSMMSTSVLERTHELGVMQSLGATPSTVRRMVVHERLLISAGSGLLGILLGSRSPSLKVSSLAACRSTWRSG